VGAAGVATGVFVGRAVTCADGLGLIEGDGAADGVAAGDDWVAVAASVAVGAVVDRIADAEGGAGDVAAGTAAQPAASRTTNERSAVDRVAVVIA
jgi:hypothetical protein